MNADPVYYCDDCSVRLYGNDWQSIDVRCSTCTQVVSWVRVCNACAKQRGQRESPLNRRLRRTQRGKR